MLSNRRPTLVFTPPPTPPLANQIRAASVRFLAAAYALPPFAAIPNPQPLRRVAVRGDGRCLYRAIAKNLASAEGRRLSESLERADADALRNIAWKAICVDRAKEFAARHIIEGSLSAYCSQMRNPMFYGGEAEMLALSDFLKIPIKVYLEPRRGDLRNITTYGEKYAEKKKERKDLPERIVRLLYINGNHYDALLPR